jgi:trehalose-phosphatase
MPTAVLPLTPTVAQRLSGSPLVLLLDIDGTLSPLAASPEQAIVPERTRRVLAKLTETPDVHVVAVSGRGVNDARRMLAIDKAWYVGNHGMEYGVPGKPPIVRGDVAHFESTIAKAVARATDELRDIPGAVVEDKHWTASIHFRQVRDRRSIPRLTAIVEGIANDLELRLTRGKEVLELRPPVDVHKGVAAIQLAEHLGALEKDGSLIGIGDDLTDEDMFRSLRERAPRAVTVRVARGFQGVETAAEFRANDTDAVRELLMALLALRS